MPMVATAPSVPSRLTRRFGGSRGDRLHQGVDLYAERGDAITAPAPGIVRHANMTYAPGFGLYGRVVVLALDQGGEILVAHLEDVNVTAGQRVAQGDVLGTVGDTEFTQDNPQQRFTSPPHAHVEYLARGHYPVRRGTQRQNPDAFAFYILKKKRAA